MRSWHYALILCIASAYLTYAAFGAARAAEKGQPLKPSRPGDQILFSNAEKVGSIGVIGIGAVAVLGTAAWFVTAKRRDNITKS